MDEKDNFTVQHNKNELWLHHLWKENRFSLTNLFTVNGDQLKIEFPGWYNKGWGPDFKDGRIYINDTLYFGDIEIHVNESAWLQHAHHLDEAYSKVILHVFMEKSATPIKNNLSQSLPSLHLLSEKMMPFWESYYPDFKVPTNDHPGACGLMLTDATLPRIRNIILHAAETRLIEKSKKFEHAIKEGQNLDNILFSSICRSLGYSAYAEAFEHMSHYFPYSEIIKFFKSLYRQSRIEILSRWLGYMGLFNHKTDIAVNDDFRREWAALEKHWQSLKHEGGKNTHSQTAAFRPLNNPIRRLVGLYYHLDKIRFQGLFKSWLKFILDCQADLDNQARGKKNILTHLEEMFPQPMWEPLGTTVSPTSPRKNSTTTRLIGRQKQLTILINSIVPFFLAWSRINNNVQLGKIIFRLSLFLPPEGKNKITKFMEARLFPFFRKPDLINNLSYTQGLIQIHNDCCTSFYEGCDNCSLIKMMQ